MIRRANWAYGSWPSFIYIWISSAFGKGMLRLKFKGLGLMFVEQGFLGIFNLGISFASAALSGVLKVWWFCFWEAMAPFSSLAFWMLSYIRVILLVMLNFFLLIIYYIAWEAWLFCRFGFGSICGWAFSLVGMGFAVDLSWLGGKRVIDFELDGWGFWYSILLVCLTSIAVLNFVLSDVFF